MHNRKYVPGGVALVVERMRNCLKMMDQDKVESFLIESSFLADAPFKWVGLIYYYGVQNDLIPRYKKINKRYGDLPIAVELDTKILEWADKNNLQLMYDIFMIGALEALIHVGDKYDLPTGLLKAERSKYSNIPETIEECIEYSKRKIS